MSLRFVPLSLVVALVAVSCTPRPTGPVRDTKQRETPRSPATCEAPEEYGRHDGWWDERASAADYANGRGTERYASAYLEPETQSPVKSVRQFQAGKTPLAWWTADRTAIVVNAALMSDLVTADATGLDKGEVVKLTTLTGLGQRELDDDVLRKFLLTTGAVNVFMHIGAELCVSKHESADGTIEFRHDGTHVYYTNQENVEELHFTLRIRPDGGVEVEGR